MDHDIPSRKLTLAVYSGKVRLGTCVADQYRADLAEGGFAGGYCAFTFQFSTPPSLDHTGIQLRVVGTRYIFQNEVGPPVVSKSVREIYEEIADTLWSSGLRWRKYRKCILHIGTEKTGSTSIQTSLGSNRQVLQDAGFHVPSSLAFRANQEVMNHVYLAILSVNDDDYQDDLRQMASVQNHETLNKTRADVFVAFAKETSQVSDTINDLVLSNEHCHSRLVTAEEVANLKIFLDYFCDAYQIIVYLRPQHELAISQYAMLIANGVWDIDVFQPFPKPEDYTNLYTPREYFDYESLLERWSDVFGRNSIEPRIYGDEKSTFNFDVVGDFVGRLSVDVNRLIPVSRSNGAISGRGLCFLRNLYRQVSDIKAFCNKGVQERLREAVIACMPGEGLIPRKAEVTEFSSEFERGNEALRAQWFPTRNRLFNWSLDLYPLLEPENTFEVNEVKRFYEWVVRDDLLSNLLTPEDRGWIKKVLFD
jgi:hypothetical protein